MRLTLCALFLHVLTACSALYHTELTKRNSTGLTDTVTWDPHSLFIHGQRIFVLSAEVHPWRLPGNPDLWADIFQKVKANGFNAVSFYVNWALHFPSPTTNGGEGDFEEGTYRDIQRYIDEAKKAGLWMIARPGPYINGETSGGGFPGWVGNIAGSLRANNTNYQEAWTPYMTSITKIIAKNQISNGGPIILVQAENEYSASASNDVYMQEIIDLYHANGIVVPITFNDQHGGLAGNFSPDRPGTHVDIYCLVEAIWLDGVVPHLVEQATRNSVCPFVVIVGSLLIAATSADDLANADYGINEARVATPKMNEMRLQGLFLRVSRDLLGATLIANGTNYTSSDLIHTAELRNLDNGAAFYILRQNDSTSTAVTTTLLTVDTSAGSIVVPKSGSITFNGRDSKILVTDYVFGITTTRILYSTAEIMTIGTTDYIAFYAGLDQTGETAFQFGTAPRVSGPSTVLSSYANGTLTLSYTLNGSQFVTIENGEKTIVAVILDKATASNWHAPVIPGSGNFGEYFSVGTNQSVLVSGPYIVRTAEIQGNTLALTGDINGTTPIEFVAPSNVRSLTWNGVPARLEKSSRGSYTTSITSRSGPTLPVLNNWKVMGSLPEVDPAFDDSSFITANQTTTNYTNLPVLAGNLVLYSQQYGFYGGNLIFRGHFNASGLETAVTTTVQYGYAGGYSAWLNGIFLGSSQGNSSVSLTTDTWSIPEDALQVGSDNVFVILQGEFMVHLLKGE
ncbi:hypothetical protein H0H92_005449 [Tricholoma furcatifolium]|nr:hypothetical protein H0H92_005449 [Tricholoma furcatifolium]